METVQNHPITQNAINGEVCNVTQPANCTGRGADHATGNMRHRCPCLSPILTILVGPVAQNARAEAQKTSSEFRDLAGARKTPDQPAATGQPLTRMH